MNGKSTLYPRVFALVVAAALGYALVLIFRPFLNALAWAAFLAFLLHPINAALRRRLRGPSAAATLLTVAAPVVILLPLAALSLEFVAQVSTLVSRLQILVRQWDIKTLADLQRFPWMGRLDLWLQTHVALSPDQLQAWLLSGTQEVLQRAASMSGALALVALGSLVSFAIMLFLLFFFLRDGDLLLARGRALIPLDEARKQRLFERLGGVTRAIVFGTSMTALLQGLFVGIGFAIASLPSPVVFGVLAGLLSMLPVGGSALVWVPATLWLLAAGHWGLGIFMLVWGLILSGLDNVVRPMLISGRARISALAVFLGVLGGIPSFGAIGVILGPVVLSLALALVEFAEEGRGATP